MKQKEHSSLNELHSFKILAFNAILFLISGKGHNSPSPHISIVSSAISQLRRCVPTIGGLASPHSVDHTEMLTPAHHPPGQAFYIWQLVVISDAIRAILVRAESTRKHIGKVRPLARSLLRWANMLSHESCPHSSRTAHPWFPDALMARHNAGWQAGVSKIVLVSAHLVYHPKQVSIYAILDR